MIAVDTNVLVYSHRQDSNWHASALAAVRRLAEGRASWAIPWPCIHEFLAIATHPRIYDPPSSLEQALGQVAAWLESPRLALLAETSTHFDALSACLSASKLTGPRVHDARVAALCSAHGITTLWTADRDFSRFPDLRTHNPLL